jgi:PAS domain S-box-containing protein
MTDGPQASSPIIPDTRQFLSAVLDTAVDAILLIDERGTIRSFNQAAIRMFGYGADETVSRNVTMLMPEPYASHHNQYIQRYLRTGKARVIGTGREVIGQRKDGSQFPMDLSVSEVKTPSGSHFVGVARDISERKQLEQSLVLASENERRLLGQELHDALGQQIAALSLLAKSLEQQLERESDDLAGRAAELAEIAAAASAETKRLAQGAYPTELEKRGFQAALTELADTTSRLFGITCSFRGRDSIPSLDKTVELNLYRIAQESVMNAVKHAKGTTIQIRLYPERGNLILSVEDDGQGPPAEEKARERNGMGLRIMKYRAGMIGATWSIRAARPRGTEVQCCLPDQFPV